MQCDSRGQVVIPKDVRRELGIEEGSAFWIFVVEKEGIFLKPIENAELDTDTLKPLKKEAEKLAIDPENIDKTVKRYRITNKGVLKDL